MCNLVPVRESEHEHSLSAVLGSYACNKDMKGRDGTFSGPASKWRGGAELKNRSAESLSPSKSSEYITGLLSHNLDVNVFMVSEMSFDMEGNMSSRYDGTEWLVLHLEMKGKQTWTASTFRRPTNKRRQVEEGSVDERMVEKRCTPDVRTFVMNVFILVSNNLVLVANNVPHLRAIPPLE